MVTRPQIMVGLAVAAAAWALVLYVQGVEISFRHFAPYTTVVGVLGVVAVAMEHWLWRVPLLQGWLFSRPNLRGTWKVTIQSEWEDPETHARIPAITAYASVVQTLTKFQLHLMTPESESCLVANDIEPTVCASRFQIAVVYANTPNVSLRGVRSERHVGAAIITTHGSKKYRPDSLTAEYWTDRKTIGSMTFEGRVANAYSRYEDAKQAIS